MQVYSVQDWFEALETQRRALKMPLHLLARRAKVSRATICRMFKEKKASCSLDNVVAVARALGAELEIRLQEPEQLVHQQIQKKAKRIVRMVQGTMALEAQGITDPSVIDRLVEAAAAEIRAKPRKQLWGQPCRTSSPSPAKHPSRISPS